MQRRPRALAIAVGVCMVMLVAAVCLPRVLGPRLEPLLRQKIVRNLTEAFACPVNVDALQIRYDHGFVVRGEGLRVQSVVHGVAGDAARPMLRVRSFSFRTGLLSPLWPRPTLRNVEASGVLLDLPHTTSSQQGSARHAGGVRLDSLTVNDAHVRFGSDNPGRASFVLDLRHGSFRGIRAGKPFNYDLTVDNGSPIGLTQTTGSIGPWNFDDPRSTPLQGNIHFENRDVSRVRGLRGRLSLEATYSGTVGEMRAQGTTDDPAFGFDTGRETVALQTRFVLTLDARNSLIRLERLDAKFLQTGFTCSGDVTKHPSPDGYNLDLHLQVQGCRIEDVLALSTRTRSPVLRGMVSLNGALRIPAGPETVSHKVRLSDAHFRLQQALFSNSEVQAQVNGMSERAAGHPHLADAQHASVAPFSAEGDVSLQDAVLHFSQVAAAIKGAHVAAGGHYDLEHATFQLDGEVHTEATASGMTTGLKSLLTRPFNGLFSHGRSGSTLPLTIRGEGDTVSFRVQLPGGKHIEAPGER